MNFHQLQYAVAWEPLLVTICAEVVLSTLILSWVSPEGHLKAFGKALLLAPLRYALLLQEIVTIGRFALDLWVTGNRRWRK